MEGEAAVRSYHGTDLPVSPLGCFNSRADLLEHHKIPAPVDQPSRHEHWEVLGDAGVGAMVASTRQSSPFCCVGHPELPSDDPRRPRPRCFPHNVDASSQRPQQAFAHVVEWALQSMHDRDTRVVQSLHCQSCFTVLMQRQRRMRHVPPLLAPPMSEAELLVQMRAWEGERGKSRCQTCDGS